MKVSQADTTLAMWKGVWWMELHVLTVQLYGWEKKVLSC